MDPHEVFRLLTDVEAKIESATRMLSPQAIAAQNHYHDHGGRGVWLATTAAVVMFAINVLMAILVVRESIRIDQALAELRQRDRAHDAYINVAFRDKKPEEK